MKNPHFCCELVAASVVWCPFSREQGVRRQMTQTPRDFDVKALYSKRDRGV